MDDFCVHLDLWEKISRDIELEYKVDFMELVIVTRARDQG